VRSETDDRARRRLPPWLKKRIPRTDAAKAVRGILAELGLVTVCQEAHCPNIMECFAKQTATFMIMGRICTRNCRFCAVTTGAPGPLDPGEPARIAEALARLKLRHAVITSVTRDDLPDGGSGHFREVIAAVRERADCIIEVLTPDFGGRDEDIARVAEALPEVYNHNVETVRRLCSAVRPQADYDRSLHVLAQAKQVAPAVATKSGLMVGMGESRDELLECLHDLRGVNCEILTIGQYLAPSCQHVPVARYMPPEEFDLLRQDALALGFRAVAAGPFVRSSYCAEHVFQMAHPLSDASGEPEK